MGGTTIARATERYPHKIHVAVYVSGSMYTSGMSGTEINDEVYHLDLFWHYWFLKPRFVISFMEWLDTHYMVMSKFTSIWGHYRFTLQVLGEFATSAQYNFAKGPDHPPTSCWPAVEVVKSLYYSNCSPQVSELSHALIFMSVTVSQCHFKRRLGVFSTLPHGLLIYCILYCLPPLLTENCLETNVAQRLLYLVDLTLNFMSDSKFV